MPILYSIGYPEALLSLTPTASWSMTDEKNYATLVWKSDDIVKPTEQQLQDEINRLTVEEPFISCKEQAKRLIAASDWSVLPDVGISNVSEFEAYRAQLRALIKSPVENPTFPTEPQPVWI